MLETVAVVKGTGTEGRWPWEAPGMELQALKSCCFLSCEPLAQDDRRTQLWNTVLPRTSGWVTADGGLRYAL